MFQSATLKLTGWYLLILMSISLLFSAIIYQVASSEVDARLHNLQLEVQRESIFSPQYDFLAVRNLQAKEAAASLLIELFYANILILAAGGIGSYVLARRTLQPIEEAHEAQSRFTSDASHELRTPLAAMKTELEVALRDPKLSKDEMRVLLASNLEEVDKLTKLSHTLLQLSRLDNTAIKKGRVVLDDVAKSVIERFDKTGTRIVFTPHVKPLKVLAHKESIEELITILVDNALKYSFEDSPITIDLKRHNKKAVFSVANNGKGISSEDLPHIFERFYRVDGSRTGGSKSGYGLGLSLAKQIIEHHDGELSASSAPEATTTFTFSLPLYSKTKNAKNSLKPRI